MKERFEIRLVLSIVFVLVGIILLGTPYTNIWELVIGVGLIIASWSLALMVGVSLKGGR